MMFLDHSLDMYNSGFFPGCRLFFCNEWVHLDAVSSQIFEGTEF